MKRALAAGAAYFLLIFLLGMALGTIRILLLEPRLGAVPSVLLELPFMLAASWFVCGWLIRDLSVPGTATSRLAMGAMAFVLLMAADLALSRFAVGGTVSGHFAGYRGGAPLIGLLGQIAFALFPLVQAVAGMSDEPETGRNGRTPAWKSTGPAGGRAPASPTPERPGEGGPVRKAEPVGDVGDAPARLDVG